MLRKNDSAANLSKNTTAFLIIIDFPSYKLEERGFDSG
jgi:hypothetical protein